MVGLGIEMIEKPLKVFFSIWLIYVNVGNIFGPQFRFNGERIKGKFLEIFHVDIGHYRRKGEHMESKLVCTYISSKAKNSRLHIDFDQACNFFFVLFFISLMVSSSGIGV
jgi:hypothetical protein